jgi:hypothetical protein
MALVALAIGLVLVVEGLVIALAPRRTMQALALLMRLTPDQRRAVGLAALAVGVAMVALGRWLGAV